MILKSILRFLVFIHRWLGIALCLVFLLWFPSGIGMMYWGFPGVSAGDRLDRSPKLDAGKIMLSPTEAAEKIGIQANPTQVRLNSFDGRPVYRFTGGGRGRGGGQGGENEGGGRGRGGGRIVYADSGEEQTEVSSDMLDRIASAWTSRPLAEAKKESVEKVDQWTVAGQLRNLRPMYKYSWPNGEQVYLNGVSGEVVQYTTFRTRLAAHVSAIPHWFYYTPLRQNQPVWIEFMIWSSLIGTIGAILGIVVAVWMYSPRKKYRLAGAPTGIPYRGQKRWHTILGLVFGIATVTWTFSGLMSLGPFPIVQRLTQPARRTPSTQQAQATSPEQLTEQVPTAQPIQAIEQPQTTRPAQPSGQAQTAQALQTAAEAQEPRPARSENPGQPGVQPQGNPVSAPQSRDENQKQIRGRGRGGDRRGGGASRGSQGRVGGRGRGQDAAIQASVSSASEPRRVQSNSVQPAGPQTARVQGERGQPSVPEQARNQNQAGGGQRGGAPPGLAGALRGRVRMADFASIHPRDLLAKVPDLDVKELEFTSFAGTPLFSATLGGGKSQLLSVAGAKIDGFDQQQILDIVKQSAPDPKLVETKVIGQYDLYYLDRTRQRPLPVILALMHDSDNTRYYIDPKTARVVTTYSNRNWVGRWLYNGLHSLNFPWLYNYRPLWDIVVITFMIGGTALCVTSLVLAWRVLGRKLKRAKAVSDVLTAET